MSSPPESTRSILRSRWPVTLAALLVLLASAFVYFWTRPLPPPRVANYVQLTTDGEPKILEATDGLRLYLGMRTSADRKVEEISVSGGDPIPIPAPRKASLRSAFLPMDLSFSPWTCRGSLESADTRRCASSPGNSLFIDRVRRGCLVSGREDAGVLLLERLVSGKKRWRRSPQAGHRPRSALRPPIFTRWDEAKIQHKRSKSGGRALWEISTQGKNLHPLLPGLHTPADEEHGKWTPDGKYFVFKSKGQIWVLPEKTGFFRRSVGKPVKLTDSPLNLDSPLPSKDGKKLFVVGHRLLGELVRYDAKSGEFLPFLSGISAEFVSFSKDGQWVAYVTYPDGVLWRSRVDGSERLPLSNAGMYARLPRWSPDGKRIVFYGWDLEGKLQVDNRITVSAQPYKVYAVSRDGGDPEPLIPNDPDLKVTPTGRLTVAGLSLLAVWILSPRVSACSTWQATKPQTFPSPKDISLHAGHPTDDTLPPCRQSPMVSSSSISKHESGQSSHNCQPASLTGRQTEDIYIFLSGKTG